MFQICQNDTCGLRSRHARSFDVEFRRVFFGRGFGDERGPARRTFVEMRIAWPPPGASFSVERVVARNRPSLDIE